MRLDGYDVFFLTGTDEHGQKMQQTAAKEGITPRELVDRNVPRFRAMVERLNCSNDDFIRTTEERHHRVVGRRSGSGWQTATATSICRNMPAGIRCATRPIYDEDETTLGEDKVRASARRARRSNGSRRRAISSGSRPIRRSCSSSTRAQPDFVLPKERLNEVASFVRGGLQDLSISRTTFDWGVTVPGDPKHVMYVWVDALTNYITGVGFPDTESEKFKRYWPADLHVIGKDIVRFHAVYWPAFLMSAGIAVPQADFRARLPVQPRREDVEVGRQRRRSVRAGRRLWRRSVALFLPARGAVRAGRQLQPRSHRQPHQCRSRQRSRQSGAALAVDDRQAVRRRAAEARRVQRQRQGDPGAADAHDRRRRARR